MAVTHATTLRSILADAVDAAINGGSGDANGDLVLREGTTELVVVPLSDPAFGAASSGVITLAGTPIVQAAGASGDMDNCLFRDKANATQISGSVTATGGGGDITVDNINIASGQSYQQNALTYTAPT